MKIENIRKIIYKEMNENSIKVPACRNCKFDCDATKGIRGKEIFVTDNSPYWVSLDFNYSGIITPDIICSEWRAETIEDIKEKDELKKELITNKDNPWDCNKPNKPIWWVFKVDRVIFQCEELRIHNNWRDLSKFHLLEMKRLIAETRKMEV